MFCFILFHDRSSSFQQTSNISVMQPWRIWDWLGGPRGWCLPRDHVSNDLHYNTIKWLVSSSKVRKHFLPFLTCFPASHPPPSRLSLCSSLKHHIYLVGSKLTYWTELLLFDQGYFFQGFVKAEGLDRGLMFMLTTNWWFYADKKGQITAQRSPDALAGSETSIDNEL